MMRKLLTILIVMAAMMLTSSCQKELPDDIKNIDVSQGEKTPTPVPDDPTQQGDIPTEDDNPWPGY